ncbi:MAG TPA: FIST N-terminal domain-containing protein [Nannocystaceae bacterium]|nr:FIST N-terminal domain-containing protein [Nannocystaceae bacterium]
MAIEGGIGVSTNSDFAAAAAEAATEALRTCASPKVALMFVNHSYPLAQLNEAIAAARQALPKGTTLAGGTVNGITYGDTRYDAMFNNKRAIAVVALGGDILVGVAIVPDPASDSTDAGRRLAEKARQGLGGRVGEGALILTPGMSGFHVTDQQLLDGIRSVNPRMRVSGTGLTAGIMPDGMILPGFAFVDDTIEQRGAVLITFAGPARMGFSSANGMQAVGGGGFVTDAEGPVIKTIDRKPARDAILELLCGDDAEAREHFNRSPFIAAVERGVTLGALDPEGGHYWCHMPVAFLPDGSAIDPFVARKGTPLSVVRIDPSTCMDAVREAGTMLVEDAGTDTFEFTLAFSCALRGYTLGADVAHEDQRLRDMVKSKNHLGIVANGEVGSYRHGRSLATGWVYALFGLAGQGG